MGTLPVEYGGDGKLPEFDCEKFIAKDVYLNPEYRFREELNLNLNSDENSINTDNHDEEMKYENSETNIKNNNSNKNNKIKNIENSKFSLVYS